MNILKELQTRPELQKNEVQIAIIEGAATKPEDQQKLQRLVSVLQDSGISKKQVYTDMDARRLAGILPEHLNIMASELKQNELYGKKDNELGPEQAAKRAEIMKKYAGGSEKAEAVLGHIARNGYTRTEAGDELNRRLVDETLASVGLNSRYFKTRNLDKGHLEGSALNITRDTVLLDRKQSLIDSFKHYDTEPQLSKAIVTAMMHDKISLPEFIDFATSIRDLPYKQGVIEDKTHKGPYTKSSSNTEISTRIFVDEDKPGNGIIVIPESRLGFHSERDHRTFKRFQKDTFPDDIKLEKEKYYPQSYVFDYAKIKDMNATLETDRDAGRNKFIARVTYELQTLIDPKLQIQKEAEQRKFTDIGYFTRLNRVLSDSEHYKINGNKQAVGEVRLAEIILDQAAREGAKKNSIKKEGNPLLVLDALAKKIEASFEGKIAPTVAKRTEPGKVDILRFDDAGKLEQFIERLAEKFPKRMESVVAEVKAMEAGATDNEGGDNKTGTKKKKTKTPPDFTARVREQNAEAGAYFTNQHFARSVVEIYNDVMGAGKGK